MLAIQPVVAMSAMLASVNLEMYVLYIHLLIFRTCLVTLVMTIKMMSLVMDLMM